MHALERLPWLQHIVCMQIADKQTDAALCAPQKRLHNELADTNGLLDNSKRKLAMLSQSAAAPAVVSKPEPVAVEVQQVDTADLQRLAQRRTEELEDERASSILLQRRVLTYRMYMQL